MMTLTVDGCSSFVGNEAVKNGSVSKRSPSSQDRQLSKSFPKNQERNDQGVSREGSQTLGQTLF